VTAELPQSRASVLGFGFAATCFLVVTGHLGFTLGEEFVDNTAFSKIYGLFVTGMTLVPLLTWRSPGGRRRTVERAINRLKGFRAVATRYEKRAYVYLGTVTVATLMIWLRT